MFKRLPNTLITLLLAAAAVFVTAAPAAPTTPPALDPQAVLAAADDPAPTPPPPADEPEPEPEPEPSIDCHYRYCESSTSWCFYWGGVTGYDVSRGPIPGETRTSLGTCDPATEVGPEPTFMIPPMW